jgi:hypothetical protein
MWVLIFLNFPGGNGKKYKKNFNQCIGCPGSDSKQDPLNRNKEPNYRSRIDSK